MGTRGESSWQGYGSFDLFKEDIFLLVRQGGL
jgi:hypothetical protein